MFSGGCVFIDHASGYIIIKHQVAIKATETFQPKLTFEREDQSQGVAIKQYHTNNGIFNYSDFIEELLKKQQNIRLSGSDALHQNGATERAIKKLVTMEGTMLMQAALRCREEKISTDLCLMSMDYAVWVYNWIPDMQSEWSAIEIW